MIKKYNFFTICVIIFLLLILISNNSFAHGINNSKTENKHNSMTHSSEQSNDKINVAVYLYDGALLLDYGISAEMFLAADYMRKFYVYTVSRTKNSNISILGSITVDFTIDDAPKPDIIIVPGGPTWQSEGGNQEAIAYFNKSLENDAVLFTVCTGSLLLAKAGILDNRRATTLHAGIKMLENLSPSTKVFADSIFVDDGNIVTSAGSGSAIEATLHMITRFTNSKIANDLGDRYLDYPHMGK